MKRLRVAIVGTGGIAKAHMTAFKTNQDRVRGGRRCGCDAGKSEEVF